ncbi:transposase [Actinomadura sp. 9N407]|uniref:transposase n=1 Tax=Actinomadura sp. 9N407 TaxID=3375154 RepID=UPI0037ACAABA
MAQVAKDLGVNHETLRTLVRKAQEAERPGAAAETAKDAELARLRQEATGLEREMCRVPGLSRSVHPGHPAFFGDRGCRRASL